MRRSKGKELAEIYDMIVAPLFDENDQSEIVNQARKILEKELQRANEFANDALNSASVSGKVLSRMLSMGAKNER